MTTIEPQVNPNGRYSQVEAARHLGVDRKTISRWMKDNRIKVGYRRLDGRAFISGQTILQVWRGVI